MNDGKVSEDGPLALLCADINSYERGPQTLGPHLKPVGFDVGEKSVIQPLMCVMGA